MSVSNWGRGRSRMQKIHVRVSMSGYETLCGRGDRCVSIGSGVRITCKRCLAIVAKNERSCVVKPGGTLSS